MSKPRPLSPHLQIYKPQITSALSIFHRMTGIALSLGSILFVLWLVTLSLGEKYYYYYLIFSRSWFGTIILIAFTFAFNYHLSNGIRHLFWDFGYGYDLQTVNKSGFAVIFSSIILTVIVWSVVLFN